MLARENRLTTSADFGRAVRSGHRTGGPLLVVHLLPADEHRTTVPAHVGFVVARSVGNAVIRNLVKRRLRHLARERIPALPGGCLLVVRALPASAGATYAELGSELDRCLQGAASRADRAAKASS